MTLSAAERTDRWVAAGVLALTAAALAPIWAFPAWLTQDGPGHAYAARVLLSLGQGGPWAAWYEATWAPVPNLAGTAAMMAASAVAPGPLAERVVASLVVGGTVWGALAWARAGSRQRWPVTALVAPALALNTPLYQGFYSFGLGLGPMLAAWAAAATGRWAWAAAFSAGAWACHIVPALGAGVALGVFGVAAWWRTRQPRALLGPTLAGLPLVVATALWGGPGGDGELVWLELGARMSGFFGLRAAAPFAGALEWAALALAALLMLLCVARLSDGGAPRLFVAVLAALALAAPEGGPNFWYLGDRLALLPFLAALALTVPRWPRAWAAVGTLATAAALSLHAAGVRALQPDAAALAQALAAPIDAPRGAPAMMLDYALPTQTRFHPFVHALGYAAATKGWVDLSNHEPETGYFQLSYKAWVRPPGARTLIGRADALRAADLALRVQVLVTHAAPSDAAAELRARYDRVAESGPFQVFVRRAGAP